MKCNSRVTAVDLAAPLALLSIYQASLGERLMCLRFSPWALRAAPPKPCCAASAFAHSATRMAGHVVLGAGLLCKTLPGILLCQIWHAQTRCAHASGPDVPRSATLTVLHWMPPVPLPACRMAEGPACSEGLYLLSPGLDQAERVRFAMRAGAATRHDLRARVSPSPCRTSLLAAARGGPS